MILTEFFFWLSVITLFHTYIFYPLLLKVLSSGKKQNSIIYHKEEKLPSVSILIAAYNEEEFIGKKLGSILSSNYPKENIEVIIGSDNSTDKTNQIVLAYCDKFPLFHLQEFKSRIGKVEIINALYKKVKHDFLILTDANVLFDKDTIYELLKHFRNQGIALVDSNMINSGLKKEGISVQEKTYIQSEVAIKNAESKLWGTMMGPFGGCYALRKDFFSQVPKSFLVDDFYINMKVLEKGGKCINEINAKVYEDVSNNLQEEFRRKVRIATGNFQNLFAFAHLLFRFNKIAFCFFSHKVLRWLGPLFLLTAYVSNLFLFSRTFYMWVFIVQTFFYLTPFFDFILKKASIHFAMLRFATHMLAMNLALLAGLIKFLRGVKSSVWQPTQRNQ